MKTRLMLIGMAAVIMLVLGALAAIWGIAPVRQALLFGGTAIATVLAVGALVEP